MKSFDEESHKTISHWSEHTFTPRYDWRFTGRYYWKADWEFSPPAGELHTIRKKGTYGGKGI